MAVSQVPVTRAIAIVLARHPYWAAQTMSTTRSIYFFAIAAVTMNYQDPMAEIYRREARWVFAGLIDVLRRCRTDYPEEGIQEDLFKTMANKSSHGNAPMVSQQLVDETAQTRGCKVTAPPCWPMGFHPA